MNAVSCSLSTILSGNSIPTIYFIIHWWVFSSEYIYVLSIVESILKKEYQITVVLEIYERAYVWPYIWNSNSWCVYYRHTIAMPIVFGSIYTHYFTLFNSIDYMIHWNQFYVFNTLLLFYPLPSLLHWKYLILVWYILHQSHSNQLITKFVSIFNTQIWQIVGNENVV